VQTTAATAAIDAYNNTRVGLKIDFELRIKAGPFMNRCLSTPFDLRDLQNFINGPRWPTLNTEQFPAMRSLDVTRRRH